MLYENDWIVFILCVTERWTTINRTVESTKMQRNWKINSKGSRWVITQFLNARIKNYSIGDYNNQWLDGTLNDYRCRCTSSQLLSLGIITDYDYWLNAFVDHRKMEHTNYSKIQKEKLTLFAVSDDIFGRTQRTQIQKENWFFELLFRSICCSPTIFIDRLLLTATLLVRTLLNCNRSLFHTNASICNKIVCSINRTK